METKDISTVELGLSAVEEYLEQIDRLEREGLDKVRNPQGSLPQNWGKAVKDFMIAKAGAENMKLIPLIKAEWEAPISVDTQQLKPSPIGKPMEGAELDVTGHISESTLWLIDSSENTMQTMIRLAVKGPEGTELVDFYSTPVYPGFAKTEDGRMANVQATEASKARNILAYFESNPLKEVLGWVPIHEIAEHKVPSYE
jgi:hypothetical protein